MYQETFLASANGKRGGNVLAFATMNVLHLSIAVSANATRDLSSPDFGNDHVACGDMDSSIVQVCWQEQIMAKTQTCTLSI